MMHLNRKYHLLINNNEHLITIHKNFISFPNVRNSTTLVNSLMNITIDLKFIFIIDAFREYNSHLQDITS